jgi:hypothetical protein
MVLNLFIGIIVDAMNNAAEMDKRASAADRPPDPVAVELAALRAEIAALRRDTIERRS